MDSDIQTWGQNYAALLPLNYEGKGGSGMAIDMDLPPTQDPDLLMGSTIWIFWGHNLTATWLCPGKFWGSDITNSGSKDSSILIWGVSGIYIENSGTPMVSGSID